MEKILVITEILKEVCPDITIKVNPKELKFSRAFQVEEFIDMCFKFNERVSENSSDESAALPLHGVSVPMGTVCDKCGNVGNNIVPCPKCGKLGGLHIEQTAR